ncbi:MAG TPA: BamA/TamA family outer membrane protein [Gemmatimonadales bacterium]
MTVSIRTSLLILGTIALAVTASPTEAQYFGRNKVQYERFDFVVLRTEHFDIYHYPEEREAAVLSGRMAERWYSRLSRLLNHELSSRQPLIMYASHPHFEQTNALTGELGESTGGVTEVFKRRMVLPFAGGLAETDHVLGHELVHAFQFEITGEGRSVQTGGIPGALRLPLWFIEGMAEYLSIGPIDGNTAMWIRDGAARDKLPSLQQLGDPYTWFPYRWGHALWAYVGGRYGDEVVGRLLKTAGRAQNPEMAISRLLGTSADSLSGAWHRAIHTTYDPLVALTTPASEYGTRLFSDGPAGETSVAPSLSPDGRYLAFISARDLFSIDIFIGDVETGKIVRKVTRTAVDPHFESLQFINSAGAWSPDGRRFALAGVTKGKPVLSLIDVESGDRTRDIVLPELDEIYNPDWSPDGRHIVFSALRGGLSDLFLYDLEGSLLRRLTNDPYGDIEPTWSPDGSRIAFATDRFTTDLEDLAYGPYQLAILTPATGAIEHVASFDAGRLFNPQWSADGASLLFLSDRSGITNVYRIRLADGETAQVTNLYTGVSGITPLSPALTVARTTDKLVMSVYQNDGYQLYAVDDPTVLAGTPVVDRFASVDPASLPPAERITDDVVTVLADARTGLADTLEFETDPYSPGLALDYVAQPSLIVGTSSFGTAIGGGAALYWSDMLGNRNLTTALQVNGSLKDIGGVLGYTNLTRRLNWGIFAQQVPYLTGFVSGFFTTIDSQTVFVEQVVKQRLTTRELTGLVAYPFSRVRRVEASAGVRDIRYGLEVRERGRTANGDVVLDTTDDTTLASIQVATASLALVYDNSLQGATSPIVGQRYRFEISPALGNASYVALLGDVRKYIVPVRPFTFATRLFHYGRWGGRAAEERLQPIFLGYPGLVRGYDNNSFASSECDETPDCGNLSLLFDRLQGSRVAVASAEIRFPLLGALGVGSGYYGYLPIELAFFGDAGLAWSANNPATSRNEQAFFLGGNRYPVYSSGLAVRMNLFGFAVVEFDYAYAFERKRWTWQFGFIPGF